MLCYGLVPQLTKLQAKETLPEEDYVLLLCSQELAAQTTMQDTEERLGELKRVRFCRVISEESGCSGSLYIPKRNAEAGHDAVCFYQHQNHIVILDDSNLMETLLERIQLQCKPVRFTAARLLCELLYLLLEDDLPHLEKLQRRIEDMEDTLLEGRLNNFSHIMIRMRKQLLSNYRYYDQLIDIAQKLQANEAGIFDTQELALLTLFSERAQHLQSETRMLREYTIQVLELYHAKVDERENNIMKILTIVTTIFLPLSLIASWYGMNFAFMPELKWRFGYPAIIVVSILVVLFCIWLCKKKKFW